MKCQDCNSEMHQHQHVGFCRSFMQAECKNPHCDLYDITLEVSEFPLEEVAAESYRIIVRNMRKAGRLS